MQERSQLYQALGKVAGSRWIVDTGKEPVFGASLTHLSPTVVDFVHVVRDPRGVAYSCKKRVRSDSEPDFMPRRPAAATAWRWLVTNLMAQIALRRLAHRYVLVRYEDLVAAPEACLMRVAKATGLPFADPQAAVDDLARPPQEHHRVAGNPGVRQLRGALRLSLDDSGEPDYQSASSEPSLRSARVSWLPTATRCERPRYAASTSPARVDAITACAHRARSVVVTAERRAKRLLRRSPTGGEDQGAGWSGRGRTDGRRMRPRPDPRPNG